MIRRHLLAFVSGLILLIGALEPMLVFAQQQSHPQGGFVVNHFRFDGLKRIPRQTVLNYIPVKPGMRLHTSETDLIVRSLYRTGFFSNVTLSRDHGDLIIHVIERPTIGSITFSGNHDIEKKKLLKSLKKAGIVRGRVLDDYSLAVLKQTILGQYRLLGRYKAQVVVAVDKISRNRVNVHISIIEGHIARISSIKIFGNQHFSKGKILSLMDSTMWMPWSIITHGNRYSPEKLAHDVSTISNFYFNHGYLNFRITRQDVRVSKDGRYVRIKLYLSEGPIYHVAAVHLEGKMVKHHEQLFKLVKINSGEVFSRKKLLQANKAISDFYANQGYAFANIDVKPKIDPRLHTVVITFIINPGRQIYINRIHFKGNALTADYVLRREMRLMEASPYNLDRVNESKRRLANLGYISRIDIKQVPVMGSPNLTDLVVKVQDHSSARANFNVGYSDVYSFIYGANISEPNFLGTGRHVNVGFNNSKYQQNYSFSYTNPYFTPEGESLGYTIYSQRVTPGKVNLVSYTQNNYGGDIIYGIPITEYQRLAFSLGYQHVRINPSSGAPLQILDFVNRHGRTFNQVKVGGAWTYNSYDRIVFPTKGFGSVGSAEMGVPAMGHSLNYYKFNYQLGYYHPVYKGFIVHFYGDFGYGDGYKTYTTLPFFKNYYAGGVGTVRGFEGNTLGPRGICVPESGPNCVSSPIGGNILTAASAELILPSLITQRVRTALFIDGGNVFASRFQGNQLRYSMGVAFRVVLPIVGQMEFYVAKDLKDKPGDRRRTFDFSFGSSL